VRRKRPAPARDSAAGELLAHERACAAAGDAERLAAARSWRHMLACADGDPAVAELFAVFAQEDR
jgi:hypothetical protein